MKYTIERIGMVIQELAKARYPHRRALQGWEMRPIDHEMGPEEMKGDGQNSWAQIPHGGIWGGDGEYYAFRHTVVIPEEMDHCPVEVEIRTGREGEWDAENPQFTAYVDGRLRQGLDVNHRTIRLGDDVRAGERHEVFLSAFTGTQRHEFPLLFDASLYAVDEETNRLYFDLLIPWQIAGLQNPQEELYAVYMNRLSHAVNLLDLRRPGSDAFRDSVRRAEQALQEMYREMAQPDSLPQVSCIGHTHIDVAWLWTLEVTREKAVRSFATVLELMRRYPDYLFMSSQPLLYQFVKEQQPALFAQIKERAEQGRWEPEGGMYVEADCNLSSGESLIRQFVYGKRFFREEFDRDNEVLWLPDAFGYSAALPQIMEKCGIRYFMTTKISWNDTNLLPMDTFIWKGIDGTGILTHLIPTRDYVMPGRVNLTSGERHTAFTTNYNGYLNPSQIKGGWQRYQQKALNEEVLCSFGYGDGGGGPTEEMLETQRRLQQGLPGCPRTRLDTVGHFFHRLEEAVAGKELPVWNGELYLEYHRGTYTSMARNKRDNRRSEFALENLESLGVLGMLLQGQAYPQEFLEEQWKTVLLNQFHDILPGSAIEQVYVTSQQQYLALLGAVSEQAERQRVRLAEGAGRDLVFNMNGKPMSGYVYLPDGAGYPSAQKTWDGQYLAWAGNVPAKGFKAMTAEEPDRGQVAVSRGTVDTPYARVIFDDKGRIVSWYDKTADREILQEGRLANQLVAYEDRPFEFDNWNVESYYREKGWPVDELVSCELAEGGPYRYTLRFVWTYQDSRIREHVSFYANMPRVDFALDVDWKEHHTLLKALFPVELNTAKAVYEIQYGNVERPTTKNTSWEQARFEVCFHKWMDLSEGDYGVSFLNDCKYGVGVDNNEVGLTLIKSGTYPNPHADQEMHHMVFAVLPHTGTWLSAGVVDQAYLLNNPLIFCGAGGETDHTVPERASLAQCDAENVMIEVVKKADRADDVVMRLYEYGNRRTKAHLRLGRVWESVWEADMLENKGDLIARNTDMVELTLKPFEIRTLMLGR